ncbi:hypothetical protein AB0C52_29325, partial [Streptomyces sp. NPDC048717]|uniref:hypothetical protein n=1 Tax=Streptomyces sp. NPDC048717 TaxID=3154928 RepID=UPI00341AC082
LDHPKMDGVSTNLALIFGTLLSSQGADASFVLTLSGFPPGASFVSDSIRSFRSDSLGAFRSRSLSLPFPSGVSSLSDLFDPIRSALSVPSGFHPRALSALSDFIRPFRLRFPVGGISSSRPLGGRSDW